MHSSTRAFALRAAAKVAMSVSVGCGGMVAETGGADKEPATDDSGPADAVATDVAVSSDVIAATSCSEKVGRDAFTCCIAEVDSKTAADAGVKGDACCNLVIDFLELSTDTRGEDYAAASKNAALQICCRELSAWSKSACTPWGPPAPPALEEVA